MQQRAPQQRHVDLALSLRGVTKSYPLYARPLDILLEALTGRVRHQERTVLKDVSLDVGLGEVVGIIGANGAGKSTLLKLIAGTLEPTAGSIAINGRIAAILELGTGFNPAYSGRDNVVMSSVMRGMSEAKARQNLDAVVAFSGLGDVIDQPFHTYSSGMQARLAFAAAIAVEADIIIIDEALAAGDARFTAKSLRRIRDIAQSGATCLFVSHVTYQIMQLCSRAIWMDGGSVRMDGSAIEVVRAYEYEMHHLIAGDRGEQGGGLEPPTSHAAELPALARVDSCGSTEGTQEVLPEATSGAAAEVPAEADLCEDACARSSSWTGPAPHAARCGSAQQPSHQQTDCSSLAPVVSPAAARAGKRHHFASGKYRITAMEMFDANGRDTRMFRFGERFSLRVAYECLLPEIPEASCGVAAAFTRVEDFEQIMYFNTNYPHSDAEVLHYGNAPFRQYRGRVGVVRADIASLQVRPGRYFVSVGILPNQQSHHEFYEYHHLAYEISVLANGFEEPCVFYPLVEWTNEPPMP